MYAPGCKVWTFENINGMQRLSQAKVVGVVHTEDVFVVEFQNGITEHKTFQQLVLVPLEDYPETQELTATSSSSGNHASSANMGEPSEQQVSTPRRRLITSQESEVATTRRRDETCEESTANLSSPSTETSDTVTVVKRSPRKRNAPVRYEASGYTSPLKSPRRNDKRKVRPQTAKNTSKPNAAPTDGNGSPGPMKRGKTNESGNSGEDVTPNIREDDSDDDDATQLENDASLEGSVARSNSSCVQCIKISQEIAELKKFFEEKLEQLSSELVEHRKQTHSN